MSFASLLRQRVVIQRPTENLSGTGVATRTFAPIASDVPAALDNAAGRQDSTDPGRLLNATWRAFVHASVDVKEGDRITLGGRTFDVILVENLRDHHLELTLAVAAA